MDLLAWVIVGLAAGWLAQTVLKDDWRNATASNLAVGAVGAVVVGWVTRATGVAGTSGLSIWILIAAFAGAAAALWAGRSFTSTPILR